MRRLSEKEILELKEECLPKYLKHDIDEYVKYKDDKTCTFIDCLENELYDSINCAEEDKEITQEFANYLRKKYLYK